MYLVQIFRASPLMGLALCICLTTIFWCFLMAKRQQVGLDKILTGVLGLIAIYEAIRVLKDAGVILFPGIQQLDGWVDFLIASMYFIAALILKVSSSERNSTNVRLRLVEANEKTAEPSKGAAMAAPEPVNMLDSSPLAAFAVDIAGVVVYWNAAAERILGWKREEVLGQPPLCGTGPLRNKQGQETGAAVWTSPLRAPSGATRGTLIMAADQPTLAEAGPTNSQLALQR
jgi:PAS domain-containing protein